MLTMSRGRHTLTRIIPSALATASMPCGSRAGPSRCSTARSKAYRSVIPATYATAARTARRFRAEPSASASNPGCSA